MRWGIPPGTSRRKFHLQRHPPTRLPPHQRSPQLHRLAFEGRLDQLQALVAPSGTIDGSVLNATGKRRETLLHAAVRGNHPNVVEWLVLVAGADVGAQDFRGMTAVHWAVRGQLSDGRGPRRLRILRLLLEQGRVDLNAFTVSSRPRKEVGEPKRSWELNALRLAVAYRQDEEVLDLLESHGAMIGCKPPEGGPEEHGDNEASLLVGVLMWDYRDADTERLDCLLRRYPSAIHLGGEALTSVVPKMGVTRQLLDRLADILPITADCLPILYRSCAHSLTQHSARVVAHRSCTEVSAVGGVQTTDLRSFLRSGGPYHYELIDVLLLEFDHSCHVQSKTPDPYWVLDMWKKSAWDLREFQAPVLFEAVDLV